MIYAWNLTLGENKKISLSCHAGFWSIHVSEWQIYLKKHRFLKPFIDPCMRDLHNDLLLQSTTSHASLGMEPWRRTLCKEIFNRHGLSRMEMLSFQNGMEQFMLDQMWGFSHICLNSTSTWTTALDFTPGFLAAYWHIGIEIFGLNNNNK